MTEELQTNILVLAKPNDDIEVMSCYSEALKLKSYAEARIILTVEDIKNATNDLSIIAELGKAIEERRKSYLSPFQQHIKEVNEAFKTFTEPLLQADTITRKKVLDYRQEQERIRQEQERINQLRMEAAERDAALHNGEISEPVNLVETQPEQLNHYRTDMGTLGTTKKWEFEVVDFSILSDQYKLPDMVKIRKVITAGASVQGVRAWQETSLRVTTFKA